MQTELINNIHQAIAKRVSNPMQPHEASIIIPVADTPLWQAGRIVHFKAGQRYAIGEQLNQYEAGVLVRTGKALVIQPACHVYMTVEALDILMGRA